MKYVVILGDGMSDFKIQELDNKTPLEYANKPTIDEILKSSDFGLVNTVPDNMSPGSDIANLSVLGYDPKEYYSGRSSLEAVSMGIELDDNDSTFRCNLVSISEENNIENCSMLDHSSGEISTEEARIIIKDISKILDSNTLLYPGVSYRHCLVYKNLNPDVKLTPPHDIIGKKLKNYLPTGKDESFFLNFMKKSREILKHHPINIKRIKANKNPANFAWFWGKGIKSKLPSFNKKYNIKGSVISAVDLIKGIGICANLESINVKGATGTINTNYSGKVEAAMNSLKDGKDFVYIHIEAPDECGHRGEIYNKVKSIELIDKNIVSPVLKELSRYKDFKLLLLPDHPTPIKLRTHTSDPVPFLIYSKNNPIKHPHLSYNETDAKKTGYFINKGHKLMDYFLEKKD